MSMAELKQTVVTLTAEERFELAAFLAELDEGDENRFNQMISQRMDAMDSGHKVTMEQFESEHRRRSAEGR